MIAFRAFPWDPAAPRSRPGGALWIPRRHQGLSRHDNPGAYGCLYASESEVAVVAESLLRFQGTRTVPAEVFRRTGLPLAVAALELPDDAEIVDLDAPRVLTRERLRPSEVATRERRTTQAYAARLYTRHPDAVALRWWSAIESSWLNLTIFGRARMRLRLLDVRSVTFADPSVRQAAEVLGLELPSGS